MNCDILLFRLLRDNEGVGVEERVEMSISVIADGLHALEMHKSNKSNLLLCMDSDHLANIPWNKVPI